MAIDKSWKDEFVLGLYRFAALVMRFELRTRANCDNRVAFHHDGAVIIDVPLAVHRDDNAGDDRIDALFRRLAVEKNREANVKRTEQRENFFSSHPWFHFLLSGCGKSGRDNSVAAEQLKPAGSVIKPCDPA